MSILSARAVSRSYRSFPLLGAARVRQALDGISLDIASGESVALLGRSGCGKSTLARVLTGLEPPDQGEVFFRGRPFSAFRHNDWLDMRRSVQMVFQDALGAVDPRASVGEIIAEPLRHLCGLTQDSARERVCALLRLVELTPDDAEKYPQQMSGGQLQRVCIARALAPGPHLLILDEAVSNLDLHLQIQMLNLFDRLQRENQVSYLFVTHDLRLAERFCARIVVMQKGRVVEETQMARPLVLTSDEGRALKDAVLPPLPSRRHALVQ